MLKGNPKKSLINIAVTSKERRAIQANARKYAAGNLSEWLRRAGVNYVPPEAASLDSGEKVSNSGVST